MSRSAYLNIEENVKLLVLGARSKCISAGMSRPNRGPKLPAALLDRVHDGGVSKRNRAVSRKDRRKAERQSKKGKAPLSAAQRARQGRRPQAHERPARLDDESDSDVAAPRSVQPMKDTKPVKSILKKRTPAPAELEDSEDDDSDSGDDLPSAPAVSRAARSKLEEDDAEIAALERKLGMKGKQSKKVGDDALDWLVTGSDDDGEGTSAGTGKRKRPEDDEWLQKKRAKAAPTPAVPQTVDTQESDADSFGFQSNDEDEASESDDGSIESDDGSIENPFSDDEVDSDDFDDAGEDDEPAPPGKRVRENPYVAPITKDAVPTGKYIPPSLRKAAASDDELLRQLKRQLQGLLNRLSEANILSILQSVEEIYEKNARQHVTTTLIELLIGLATDPSILSETFLILHAGFATALFKIIGVDFGAQLLEQIVLEIDKSRDDEEGKRTLNLIGFLSNLYTLQMTSSIIIFDYIRIFLTTLSEPNTELLLRMIRTSGTQLRSDDPTSLKDIVLILQRSVASLGGEANLPVRTKFMIETINNLKNNRMKTGVLASAVTAEHITRMKRTLGSLNTRSTRAATEPLSISLSDIRNTSKKGKWWLIGASYHDPAKLASNPNKPSSQPVDTGYESETPNSVSLTRLAKAQGMNTSVRKAIFITLLSSSDAQEAHTRLLKLHLKNKQQLEIPRVLLHCCEAESVYNPYYTVVARRFCADRPLRKAFQYQLWDIFRRLGDGIEGQDNPADLEGGEMAVPQIVSLGKFFGSLIVDSGAGAGSGLSIASLRALNLMYLRGNGTQMFVEVLLTTILLQSHAAGKKSGGGGFEETLKGVFGAAASAQGLVQGLRYIVETYIAKATLANGKKERRIIEEGCEHAVQALAEAAAGVGTKGRDQDLSDSE
ncbi:suppressor of glycerol defect [Oleoguttula sp. CCFEE 5521]